MEGDILSLSMGLHLKTIFAKLLEAVRLMNARDGKKIEKRAGSAPYNNIWRESGVTGLFYRQSSIGYALKLYDFFCLRKNLTRFINVYIYLCSASTATPDDCKIRTLRASSKMDFRDQYPVYLELSVCSHTICNGIS